MYGSKDLAWALTREWVLSIHTWVLTWEWVLVQDTTTVGSTCTLILCSCNQYNTFYLQVAYHDVPHMAYEVFVNAVASKYLDYGRVIPSLMQSHNSAGKKYTLAFRKSCFGICSQ